MPSRRQFLNPSGHCLAEAARWLVARFGLDMQRIVVVTPVGRAGRRLLELLTALAAERGGPLVPPRITTVGGLVDALTDYPTRIADPVVAQLAWARALRETDPSLLAPLVPDPPDPSHALGWAALAEQVASLHSELAGESLSFADVPQRAADWPDFNDEPRWAALADVHERYLAHLAAMSRADEHAARRAAIDEGRLDPDKLVVVIAAADLNRIQRDAIDAVGDRATLLVHAAEADADRFDAHGCVIPEQWAAAPIALDDARWVVADSPADQADAAVNAIAALGGAAAAEQITIGVADESVTPYLVQTLPAYGLPVRDAAGTPVARTRPARLLIAMADWLDGRRFTDFATLLRHPDVEAALADLIEADDAPADPDDAHETIDDWLTLLDKYYADHLAARVTGDWLGVPDRRRRMKRVHDAVTALAGDLDADRRPLDRWAQPIVDLLLRIYSRPGVELDRRREPDRLVIESCGRLHKQLIQLHDLSDRHAAPAPGVSAAEAMRLTVRFAERADDGSIPPEPDAAAIELLGPLELHLDDADALVITGVNEGKLPTSINAHPFLPDHLRRHLGLMDNARRYARDAYALSAILASRPHVTLVTGRRTASRDPLTPSRLVFAADPLVAARRVKRFVSIGESSPTIAMPPGLAAAAFSAFRMPPPIDPAALAPITRLSVTAFRDYLACPYRFCLRHVLRLARLDDSAQELDGGAFGNLAHDVLKAFADSDAAHESNAVRIDRTLGDLLDDRVRQLLGSHPLPAVRVQVELLRGRLSAFAWRQAEWAGAGWRITQSERVFKKGEAAIDVDGEPMSLTGRIDRIDVHESTGDVAVFDYKTSDAGAGPDKTHRSGGQWVDLQLPLYRHLVRSLDLGDRVRLGYLLLPRDPKKVGCAMAGWTDAELAEADEAARGVVRGVRAMRFAFDPSAPPPVFDDYADICGVGQLAAAMRAEGGE